MFLETEAVRRIGMEQIPRYIKPRVTILQPSLSGESKNGAKREGVGEVHQQGHTYNREIRCRTLIGVYSTQGCYTSSSVISSR